jgi:hypothetical protein
MPWVSGYAIVLRPERAQKGILRVIGAALRSFIEREKLSQNDL